MKCFRCKEKIRYNQFKVDAAKRVFCLDCWAKRYPSKRKKSSKEV